MWGGLILTQPSSLCMLTLCGPNIFLVETCNWLSLGVIMLGLHIQVRCSTDCSINHILSCRFLSMPGIPSTQWRSQMIKDCAAPSCPQRVVGIKYIVCVCPRLVWMRNVLLIVSAKQKVPLWEGVLFEIGLSDCLSGYVSVQDLYFAKSSSGHGPWQWEFQNTWRQKTWRWNPRQQGQHVDTLGVSWQRLLLFDFSSLPARAARWGGYDQAEIDQGHPSVLCHRHQGQDLDFLRSPDVGGCWS